MADRTGPQTGRRGFHAYRLHTCNEIETWYFQKQKIKNKKGSSAGEMAEVNKKYSRATTVAAV